MFNLNAAYTAILSAHNIPADLEEIIKFRLFMDAFADVWNALPADEPVAFYGYGGGWVILNNLARKLQKKNMVCTLDKHPKTPTTPENLPVMEIERAAPFHIKHVILTVFLNRDEMKRDVQTHIPGARVYDVYDVMSERGYTYDHPFSMSWDWEMCTILESKRNAYDAAHGEARRDALKDLIHAYLAVRDFVYARFYAEQYIHGGYPDSHSYTELFVKLDALFADAKRRIKQLDEHHVFMVCSDALSAELAKDMPWFNRFSDDGMVFTNAFSLSEQHTRAVFYSMLTEKRFVTDGINGMMTITRADSPLLTQIKRRGYAFKCIFPYMGHFLMDVNEYNGEYLPLDILSRKCWAMLCDLLEGGGNAVTILHAMETHAPYYSGYSTEPLHDCWGIFFKEMADEHFDGDKRALKERIYALELKRMNAAALYVDKQLEFYMDFLNLERDSVIVFGDHEVYSLLNYPIFYMGEARSAVDAYKRTALTVHAPGLTPGCVDGLFSLGQLPDIIRMLLNGDTNRTIPTCEMVRIEREPYYSGGLGTIQRLQAPYAHNHSGYIQLRNTREQYTFFLDGHEELLDLSTYEVLTDAPQAQERLDAYRARLNVDVKECWRTVFTLRPKTRAYYEGHIKPEFLPEDG